MRPLAAWSAVSSQHPGWRDEAPVPVVGAEPRGIEPADGSSEQHEAILSRNAADLYGSNVVVLVPPTGTRFGR